MNYSASRTATVLKIKNKSMESRRACFQSGQRTMHPFGETTVSFQRLDDFINSDSLIPSYKNVHGTVDCRVSTPHSTE